MGNLTAKTSGEIATFMTPAKTNIKSLKVHFSPKQLGTGDPSPENVREIVGWDGVEVNGSGKNLWKYGDLINKQNNQEYDFTYILIPNQEYTFSAIVESTSPYDTCLVRLEGDGLQEKRIQKSTNGKRTFVTFNSGSKNYNKIRLYASIAYSQDYYATYKNIQLELGSTATSYEPYQGNNISYQWKLPDEYQEVEYIEKTDYNQYIDTGVLGDGELQFKCKLNITQIKNGSPFFGSYGNSQRCYFLIQNNNNIGYSYIASEYSSTALETNKDYNINVIFKAGEQQLYIDNNIVLTTTKTGTIKTGKNIFLFGYNFDGHFDVDRSSFIKLYNAILYKDNILVRNFVPCYRKSDNEIGMYDTVSQTFYTNQGTGTFLKGEDVNKTFYGGYVDLISGELVETNVRDVLDTVNKEPLNTQYNTSQTVFFRCDTDYTFETKRSTVTGISDFYCESLKPYGYNWSDGDSQDSKVNTITQRYNNTKAVCMRMYNSVFDINADDTVEVKKQKINTWLADNPIVISYKLAEPITHQLTPTQLQSFIGQNNFWSNADYVEIEYDLIETEDIQKARKKIILNQPHIENVKGDLVNFTTNMKAPLKECKVYFEPVQEGNGDPSPDNVRNIIGWDGVNVGLPSEYQEVEYIESTGTQWIKTDIKSRPTIEYESIVEFTNGSDQYTVGFKDGNFRASGNGLYSGRTQIVYNTAYKLGVRLSLNKKYKYKTCLKPNEQNVFLDDEMVASYDLPQTETVLSDKHVGIFCQLTNDITPQFFSKIKLTSLVIKENGLLLGNFIPCYRKSDGEIGMYDTVSKTFYTNSGTGTFLKGDDVNTIIGNVNWSDEVGTVYGGYVDLVKGELVATFKKIVIDGSFDAGIFPWSSDSTDINTGKIITNALYLKKNTGDNKHNRYAIFYCNKLKNISNYNRNEVGCSMYDGSSYSVTLTLPKEDVGDTQETLKTYLSNNPIEVIFELAEPIHYSLTPQQLLTFKGENNIWSDTNGQTEVKFWTH